MTIEDLIGKPYRVGGRGPDAYDCAGLALEFQRRRGWRLEATETPDEEQDRVRVIRCILRTHWRRIAHAEPGCLVFFPGRAHVGSMIDCRRFLHSSSDLGAACIESLSDPLWRRRKRLFYQPQSAGHLVHVPVLVADTVDVDARPPRLTLCTNPFDLTRDHVTVPLEGGCTVDTALGRAGHDPAAHRYMTCCNGEVLPPERAMQYVPRAGDDLTMVPILGNSTLRTIAAIGVTIAAAAFAGPLGGLLASTFGVAASATTTAIAGALISIGGSLAIAGIASLFHPGAGGQSYGVLGPSTTARSGIPIPKGYGTIRAGFNIVESWVDIMGDNGDAHDVDDGADRIGRQYINVRFDAGYGPALAMNNLQLNGKDVSEYADVAYVLLYGTLDQAPVTVNDPRWVVLNRTRTGTTQNIVPTTGFDIVSNNYPQNQRIRAGVDRNYVIVNGQRDDTQKLTVYVSWPGGLWRYDDTMQIKRLACDYEVWYRVAGSGDAGWVLAQHHYYYNIRQSLLRQATIIDHLASGRYDVKVIKNGTGAVNNPLDYFEHESNKFGDELWLESVQETSYTTLAYPDCIQVCLRFMASGQLSGSEVSLQADITYGLRNSLPAPLAGLAIDNPAAVSYDILRDEIVGAGWPDDRIDMDWLAEMGALSDSLVSNGDGGTQKLARFNGILDQPNVNVWQALQSVCFVARAHPQRVGAKVTGWIDRPEVPVQLFHVGNTLLDSYQKTWLNLEDRAQEISVSIADAADNYKVRNPVRVIRQQDITSEMEIKKTEVNLLGCTDRIQAYYRALLLLRQSETLLRKHKWQSNRNAVRCRVGNVVLLQTDSPTNAWAGLLEPGSTPSQLLLDLPSLPFDGASNYSVVVQLPAVARISGTVLAVAGLIVTVPGYDGVTPVNRLVWGDQDVAIVAVNGNALTLESTAGLAAGTGVTLWTTDPLETATVVGVSPVLNGVTGRQCMQLTLATALPAQPADYCGCVYQSTARQALKVRIDSISKRVNDQRYTLTGNDYSDDSYNLPAPLSGQSYTPPAPVTPPAPTGPATPLPATAQPVLTVAYTETDRQLTRQQELSGESNVLYHVTGIVIQNAGSGLTSHASAVLQSDYSNTTSGSNGQATTVTDPTQNLTLTLDSMGGVASITGWNVGTAWNEVPYVVLTP